MFVKAITTQEIEFIRLDDDRICLPVGTHIMVDEDNKVAMINDNHFDINEDEYEVLYLN